MIQQLTFIALEIVQESEHLSEVFDGIKSIEQQRDEHLQEVLREFTRDWHKEDFEDFPAREIMDDLHSWYDELYGEITWDVMKDTEAFEESWYASRYT